MLRGEAPPDELETTHGIEVKPLELAHPEKAGVEMMLNCWDFGGQQIYHATHQFFLTDKSLFLLVWNARVGHEQSKLYYWLDTIKALAPESPVLLVGTHIDERDATLPYEDLKCKHPNIAGHWKVCCTSGEGVEDLGEAVDCHVGLCGLPAMTRGEHANGDARTRCPCCDSGWRVVLCFWVFPGFSVFSSQEFVCCFVSDDCFFFAVPFYASAELV